MGYGKKNPYVEKYAPVKEALAVKRAELKKLAEENFKLHAKGIFAAHPKLQSFGWHQYTPYWCDGDQCEFSVNTYDVAINGVGQYDEPEDDVPENEVLTKSELEDVTNEVVAFLESFEDQDLLHLFGDHAEVTVENKQTPEGAQITCTVDEYEHD